MRTVIAMTSTTPGDPSDKRRLFKGRTSLVTAAAIAGVLVAGTAAVAANIGILNAAESSTFGELSVTDELASASASAAGEASTAITTPTAGEAQRYDIDTAGSVWVATTTSGLALDHVEATAGWSSALSQSDLGSLQVDFSDGERTIVFTATLADDGRVVADVTEPTDTGSSQSVGATPAYDDDGQYDDDRQYDDGDDHDDDDEHDDEYDDEYDDDEHDGADDDD
jgi:hypothetical protein